MDLIWRVREALIDPFLLENRSKNSPKGIARERHQVDEDDTVGRFSWVIEPHSPQRKGGRLLV